MKYLSLIFVASFLMSCSSTRYYIVRHAEKEIPGSGVTMNTAGDPPLSEAGKKRAEELKNELEDKNVRYVFSTRTVRTLTTAEPLLKSRGLTMDLYHPIDTLDRFVNRLMNIRNGNVLIVGHSNTVDELVNKLTGQRFVPGDLLESEYDNLFIVTRKGNKYTFERKKFGVASN